MGEEGGKAVPVAVLSESRFMELETDSPNVFVDLGGDSDGAMGFWGSGIPLSAMADCAQAATSARWQSAFKSRIKILCSFGMGGRRHTDRYHHVILAPH